MNKSQTGMRSSNPLRYAFGMFGTSIPINMFKTYAAVFYIDRLGLITTPQWSLILLIYTFVDAIDNPVYGFLSDRTRTRWGRRRPWLMIGAPLLVLCFVFFYNPPAFVAGESGFAYVLLMYILTGTLDSLINSNYGALFPELFPTEAQRAKTNAMRQIFQFIAMIISIALTPVITDAIGFSTTALVYGIIAIAVIWFMATGAHEDPTAMERPKPNLFKTVLSIIANPKFWLYGVTNAAYFAGLGLVQAGVPFYTKYHLGTEGMGSTILLGIVIVSAILFIPVWVRIIRKLGLMPAWRLALLLAGAAVVPLYFAPNLVAAACMVPIFGFAMAGVAATMDIVGARVLDDDLARNGIPREGTFSSLQGVLNKTSGLFNSLAYLLVFQLYGFESGANPGTVPDAAARFLTILFPLGVLLLSFALSHTLRFQGGDVRIENGGPDADAEA